MKKPTQHLIAEVLRRHARTELTIGIDLGDVVVVGERIGDLALIKANSGWLIDTGVASTCFLRLFGAQGLHRVDFGGAPCGYPRGSDGHYGNGGNCDGDSHRVERT